MDEKRREFVLKSLIELAEDRLGKRLPPGERDYLRQMMARAWSEGRSDMATAQSATLNDVMTKLDDIKARVVSIEDRQEVAAQEEAKLDERLQVVENIERGIPWKILGFIGGAVILLLLPTVSTLIVVGRREEQMDRLIQDVRAVGESVSEVREDVGELSRSSVGADARSAEDRRRIETIERSVADMSRDDGPSFTQGRHSDTLRR